MEYSFGKFSTLLLSIQACSASQRWEAKGGFTGKRPGAKYAAIQRLDGLMAIGVKRADAKAEARLRGESTFAFSDGLIHSYETRETYQKMIMWFIDWCRDNHDVRDLEKIDQQADELACLYLVDRMSQPDISAWTLHTERSALRIFFQDRELTDSIELPERKRVPPNVLQKVKDEVIGKNPGKRKVVRYIHR